MTTGSTWLEGCVPWPRAVAHRYRAAGYWSGQTLFQFLRARAVAYGPRLALADERRRLSYQGLLDRAECLASGFVRHGIAARDRVVVQLSNRVEWFEVCFALFRLGALPIMAQPAHRAFEIGHFVRRTEAVAWVGDDDYSGFDYRELALQLRSQCASLRSLFVAGETNAPQITSLHSLLSEANAQSLPDEHEWSASDVALMQLSGGSTGAPKLIPRTHDDYLYSVRQSAAICGLTSDTTYLAALPVGHNFTLSSPGALGVLCRGGTVVLSSTPAPERVFEWFQRTRITATAAVPALARVWLDASRRRNLDLSRLQLFQVGGARLDEALARRLRANVGSGLQQVFGMAEGLVNYTRLDDPERLVLTTQGRPMSEADEIRIVDDDDTEVCPGAVGHLLARGPYTVRGYYRAPKHNGVSFTSDGYYRTGDLVRQTPEGHLVVEGRAKDQINRGGEKIAAPEVEEQLRATNLVRDAAVVALPDPFLGERSCAIVVPDGPVSARVLLDALRQRGLAGYKLPDLFEFTHELPRTPIGKVDKKTLRERFTKGTR